MKPEIDVIIPTRNRGNLIAGTLTSLKKNSFLNFKVWIVDQSDNLQTTEAVEPFLEVDKRFVLIRTPKKGSNIARNLGINGGNAPFVVLTDDDCIVAQTWLADLLAEYETHPDVASIFGRVIPGEIISLAGDNVNIEQIKRLQQILPMAKIDNDKPIIFSEDRFNLGFGHGANMSFRRTTFEQFGLFDEFLGAGAPLRSWPERDIGYRILAGGGKILYSPNVSVRHEHWREWEELQKVFRNYGFGTGAAVGKYMRIGDWSSSKLLIDWILQQGVRQILSGIFKWRSWQKTYVGLLQLVYPWLGLIYSMKYAIDPQSKVYVGLKSEHPSRP